ncbi:MAG TPA: lantibiotic immunity ABC transporter MutG family permease subunit [Caproicibacter sp.]|nr:lantibiotic immunity ABC transporter MutG family permease subunit [Caproicibacter sp.]
MTTFFRCIGSDIQKFKHTSMLWIHLLLPVGIAALFLGYYTVSPWKTDAKISAYLEAVGTAFPLIISLVCSKSIDQEGQAGSFQVMLCGTQSRTVSYFSKLVVMTLLGAFSIILAVSVFAAGFQAAPKSVYFKAMILLIAGSIFLYILHLFLSLRFGKGASIGLGIAESLISALALTGLGDGIWYYIPCTWGARLCDYLIYLWVHPESSRMWITERNRWLMFAVPATIVAFILSILWFKNWEGRKNYD